MDFDNLLTAKTGESISAATPLGRSRTAHLVRLLNQHLLRRFDARLIRQTTFDRLLNQAAGLTPTLQDADGLLSPPSRSQPDATLPKSPKVRLLSRLDQLDDILKECDAAHLISDDAMLEVFKTFEFKFPAAELPPDPFSQSYKEFQFNLYKKISGREYKLENEFTDWLRPEEAMYTPFPFYTQSHQIVSDHIIMLGLIIKTMALKPGAKILEFGCGYGNTTVALARMGYKVTAVDIEPRFLEIVNRQCQGFASPPRTVRGDFAIINELEERFDAILFYESFHHCSDHQRLVASFETRVAPQGIIVFASEPIYEEFPAPWGLRLDGQSLWAIRRFGWLELGFKESYFRDLLSRFGWSCSKYQFPVTELGTIFVAR